ncbi:MAG: hypothetical protein OXC07_03865 [Kistimonas sp.]|nr:hypothetical protein [Kistimonas sp.]
MLNPDFSSHSASPTAQLSQQGWPSEAPARVAGHAVEMLATPRKLALTLACHADKSSRALGNRALAPALVGPLTSLSVLDKTTGTQSAALAALFASPDPVRTLTQQVHEALEGTGQTYVNHTSVLVRHGREFILEQYYRDRGIQQDIVPLSSSAVAAENRRITAVTNGTIEGNLVCDPCMVFSIVNAQYLKANWAFPFHRRDTSQSEFMTGEGQVLTVETMSKRFSSAAKLAFMQNHSLQAVQLPYVSRPGARHQLSMLLVMRMDKSLKQPSATETEEAMQGLQPYVSDEGPYEVIEVCLPRFRIKSRTDLLQVFQDHGAGAALTQDKTRFPGVELGEFAQESVLKVDETGTEASAVTLMRFRESGRPPVTGCLKFNRPFTAILCMENAAGRTTGPVEFLFSGQVNDPSVMAA